MIIATIGYHSYEMNDLQSATELLRILDESKPVQFERAGDEYVYVECPQQNVEISIKSGQSFSKDDYNLLCMAKTEE